MSGRMFSLATPEEIFLSLSTEGSGSPETILDGIVLGDITISTFGEQVEVIEDEDGVGLVVDGFDVGVSVDGSDIGVDSVKIEVDLKGGDDATTVS